MTNLIKCVDYIDYIYIEILNECNFQEYLDEMDKYELSSNLSVPIRMFITDGGSIINALLLKQKIYIVNENKMKIIVVNNDDKTIISRKRFNTDAITEFVLNFDKDTYDFQITEFIHDLGYSTKSCRTYSLSNKYITAVDLSESEARELYSNFLNDFNKTLKYLPKDLCELYNLIVSNCFTNKNNVESEKINIRTK